MATTSQQIPVNREEIRMLVLDLGYEKTSEKTGIKQATLRQWSKRFSWNVTRQHSQAVTTVTRAPGDVLLDELADNERKTRMSLSRYAQRASQDSETASLRDAPYVHKAAQVAGIAFKWDAKEQQSNTVVNVAILGVDPASVSVDTSPVIDVQSDMSE